MTTTKKTTKKTAKKAVTKAAPEKVAAGANGADNDQVTPEQVTPDQKAPAPTQAPAFEPILQINCGNFGKWGLHITGQGLIAAYQFTGQMGWQQSTAFPAKLGEYVKTFMEQHSGSVSLEGYLTPAMVAAARPWTGQTQQSEAPPKKGGNRAQRRKAAKQAREQA